MTKLREVIAYMQRHGIKFGGDGQEGHSMCTMNTLSYMHHGAFDYDDDLEKDREAIESTIREQYPALADKHAKSDRLGITTLCLAAWFSDYMVSSGRSDEILLVLEKAALKREEEV